MSAVAVQSAPLPQTRRHRQRRPTTKLATPSCGMTWRATSSTARKPAIAVAHAPSASISRRNRMSLVLGTKLRPMRQLDKIGSTGERPEDPSQLVAAALATEHELAVMLDAVGAMQQRIRHAADAAPPCRAHFATPQLRAIEHVLGRMEHRDAELVIAEEPVEALDQRLARSRHAMRFGVLKKGRRHAVLMHGIDLIRIDEASAAHIVEPAPFAPPPLQT